MISRQISMRGKRIRRCHKKRRECHCYGHHHSNLSGKWQIYTGYHHDDKLVKDEPLDEVLKDADVMHHTFNDLAKPVKEKELARYLALRQEFGLPVQE